MPPSLFGLTDRQLRRVLGAACQAPSMLNTQPWAFLLAPNGIELHIDPDRVLSAGDPEGRQARLACGAALFNVRLALAHYGIRAKVTVRPDGNVGPLALVEYDGDMSLTVHQDDLERAIPHRRSNRRPFFDVDVPLNFQLILSRSAAPNSCLRLVSDSTWLSQIRRWASEAHRCRVADPVWAAEWDWWTGRVGGADGIPLNAARPAQGQWAPGNGAHPVSGPDDDGYDSGEHPLVGVLMTRDDSPNAQLEAGQAMEEVLLAATNLGLSASSLPELIEVDFIRDQLTSLLGDFDVPQAVLRLGFDGPVPPTPRRAVEDCLITTPTPTATPQH